MKTMTTYHWEQTFRFSRRDWAFVFALALSVLAITFNPQAHAAVFGHRDPGTGDGQYLIIFADSTYADPVGEQAFHDMMDCLAANEPSAVVVSAGTVADVFFWTPGWWDRWFHHALRQHLTDCTHVAGAEGRKARPRRRRVRNTAQRSVRSLR